MFSKELNWGVVKSATKVLTQLSQTVQIIGTTLLFFMQVGVKIGLGFSSEV